MREYANFVPDDLDFRHSRDQWRSQMGQSEQLRAKAVELTIESSKFSYGYQWEWCGVPIIRHPDDIVLQQEIMWHLKPKRVIETGVARGGIPLNIAGSELISLGNVVETTNTILRKSIAIIDGGNPPSI